jgi:hypothetical protein
MGKRTRTNSKTGKGRRNLQKKALSVLMPNAATVSAMKEARRAKLKSSKNVGDLMANLNGMAAGKPRASVMAAYLTSVERFQALYKNLAE